MEVILLDKIAHLGGLGDQVKVKSGFARNYLIPQKKAVMATEANKKKFEEQRAELEAKIAPSTGGLDIKVIDEKTKEPVPGATVEVIYPDGSTHTFITDENGMVTELTKTDEKGRYLAKTGEYKITVIRVPDGYTVTTGQTKTEIVETDQVKHHVAEIVTTDTSTRRPPSDKTAQTGDETPITMLFILMMISAGGFAGVVLKKKKAKK